MADLDPLQALLRRLADGRPYDLQALAHTLDVDGALLEQMLGQLEAVGYLGRVATECQHACAHCPYKGLCALTREGRIWVLTERGRKAVEHLG